MFEVTTTRFYAAAQTFAPLIDSVMSIIVAEPLKPNVKASSATRQCALCVLRLKTVREKGKNNISP